MAQLNSKNICADRAIEFVSAAAVLSLMAVIMMVIVVGATHFFKWWTGAF